MHYFCYPTNRGTDLCRIAMKYTTDKCFIRKWHSYTEVYDHYLSNRRQSCRQLLEMGIGVPSCMGENYQIGASLFMWRDYFPNAHIQAIDLDEEAMVHGVSRITTRICNQIDAQSLLKIFSADQFDVILDDGSHQPEHQIESFKILWPKVATHGFYLIEDIVTAHLDIVLSGVYQALKEMPEEIRPRMELIRIRNNYYHNDYDDNVMVLTR